MTERERPAGAAPPPTGMTRTWVIIGLGMLALVVLLIFILQNLKSDSVHFITASWRVPLGVDMLLAVLLGGFIVFCAGALRMLRIRQVAKQQAARTATQDAVTP
jgi:uncharacterized integral membrane protein